MQTPRRVPTGAGPTRRGMRWVGGRLRDPAVLTVIAVVFFVSAVGQSLAQAYLHDDSVVAVTAFSVAGSLFLAAAVIVAARRHERASRTPPSQRQDAPEAARVEAGRTDVTQPSRRRPLGDAPLHEEASAMPPHCDSLDGPIVTAARHALAAGDVNQVLPYVPADAEGEVRDAFARVLPLQTGGQTAADLAERWFFETVVRVHRAGEHAPYTGLKPAGLDVGPVIPLAEKAVESGDLEEVYRLLATDLRSELTHRLHYVRQLATDKDTSIAAGREYVEAMLGFQIYANQAYQTVHSDPHGEHQHG